MTFEVKKWSDDRKPKPRDTGSDEDLLADIEAAVDKAEAQDVDLPDLGYVDAPKVARPEPTRAAPLKALEAAQADIVRPERQAADASDFALADVELSLIHI